jgi:hypothetical protein
MKKTLLFSLAILVASIVSAQDVKRTLGVGLQASLPTYGLSVKYGLSNASVIQGTIAPFGAGLFSMNFYGGRYIHRFPDSDQGKVSLDPYVYGGAGIMSFKTDFSSIGFGKTTDNFFSYSVGGGLELIVARKLGISAELGYGRMSVIDGFAVSGILGGGGIHFYIF